MVDENDLYHDVGVGGTVDSKFAAIGIPALLGVSVRVFTRLLLSHKILGWVSREHL
jgi:hypothetical protein